MSQVSAISRVLIVPGLPAPSDNSLQNVIFQTISIGLVIDDTHVVWGEYHPDSDDDNALTTLPEKINPILVGRPLAAFREIMDALDGLTETAVISRPIHSSQPGSISRRGFLTGNLTTESEVEYEEVVVERPLPPTLRYCVSQILATALATARNSTVTELIAAEYKLPLRPSLVPLHLAIDAASPTPDASILSPPIQSLGYHITGHNPQAQLGPNGEKLQRFIRQLTTLLSRVTQPDYRPAVHLDLAGSLGILFDNNIGRILGAVYGLEQAAHPYPLYLSDPLLTEDLTQQIEWMRQLMDYIRMRRMKTRLAANTPIQSLADVQRFIDNRAAHMLVLSLSRLGTIQQSLQAVQICQQADTAVLLGDGSQPFTSQFALAAQPDLIMVTWEPDNFDNIDQIYREMAKTITFFTQIRA